MMRSGVTASIFVAISKFRPWSRSFRYDPGRLHDCFPNLDFINNQFGKVLRRTDFWLEAKLRHARPNLWRSRACVDLSIELLDDIGCGSCGRQKPSPKTPRQVR